MLGGIGRILRGAARGLTWLFGALCLLLLFYVGYALVAFRDLTVQQVYTELAIEPLAVARVAGMDLHYQVQGQGPAVLLLHSHFWNQRMFDAWAEQLAQEFTVIRFDLPGHGFAGADPTGIYSKPREIELALGLLDHLRIERASLVGSSTGAAIAYGLAARHPERVERLVLINAPGLPKGGNAAMRRALPDWALPLFYLLPEAAFKPFLGFAVADKTFITPQWVHEAHVFFRREGNRQAEFQRLKQYDPNTDARALLAQVQAPTLILWGEANPQLPLWHAQAMADSLTGAANVSVKTYADKGHVLPVESPQAAARDIAHFLRAGA